MSKNDEKQPRRPRKQDSEEPEDIDNQTETDVPDTGRETEETVEYISTPDTPGGFIRIEPGITDLDDDGVPEPPASEWDDGSIEIGTNPSEVMSLMGRYTDDEDVLDDFAERQMLTNGANGLREKLEQHHSLSPDISGDDIDASWETANQGGEETVGGTVPTPDQDIIEELGEAAGIVYNDDEPLATEDKLDARDRARWELDPASADTDPPNRDALEGEDRVDEAALEDFDDEDVDDELERLDELEDAAGMEDLDELEELEELDDLEDLYDLEDDEDLD